MVRLSGVLIRVTLIFILLIKSVVAGDLPKTDLPPVLPSGSGFFQKHDLSLRVVNFLTSKGFTLVRKESSKEITFMLRFTPPYSHKHVRIRFMLNYSMYDLLTQKGLHARVPVTFDIMRDFNNFHYQTEHVDFTRVDSIRAIYNLLVKDGFLTEEAVALEMRAIDRTHAWRVRIVNYLRESGFFSSRGDYGHAFPKAKLRRHVKLGLRMRMLDYLHTSSVFCEMRIQNGFQLLDRVVLRVDSEESLFVFKSFLTDMRANAGVSCREVMHDMRCGIYYDKALGRMPQRRLIDTQAAFRGVLDALGIEHGEHVKIQRRSLSQLDVAQLSVVADYLAMRFKLLRMEKQNARIKATLVELRTYVIKPSWSFLDLPPELLEKNADLQISLHEAMKEMRFEINHPEFIARIGRVFFREMSRALRKG